ncbi:calcium-binding protein [Methylobacterium sp. Leaf118]|uniref:calcium-binding protein n=1 Tax=Methylobacterium sp. Leaf118 TaxID=2876562 RepID=UPI001E3D397B|nr:calcium-binding protein [Methylobacterium sp. Leaf118]
MPITISITPWQSYRPRVAAWDLVNQNGVLISTLIADRPSVALGPMSSFLKDETSSTVGLFDPGTKVFSALGMLGSPANLITGLSGGYLFDLTGYCGTAVLYGGSFGDRLIGGSGNDTLDGGRGADAMLGGAGNDSYTVDDAGDQVIEAAGGGRDTVEALVTYTLAAGQEIEVLRLAAATGARSLDLTGNAFANALTGNDGDNVLDGKGGADTLTGGRGNDTYFVDRPDDRVVEAAGGGIDTVLTAGHYALAFGQEIEWLATTDAAGTAAINLTGNAFAQTLKGNRGANVLDGGAGADTLIGDAGNDTYRVDTAGDRIVEAVGGGRDAVVASVDYVLAAGQEIEELRIAWAAGDRAINLTGNDFAQTLKGNGAANRLDGGGGADTLDGGAGTDLLIGGAGNDTYLVDNAGDRIVEAVGGGRDAVATTVNYTLAAGQEIEELRIAWAAGDGAIHLTGNEFAQTLRGNGGANWLDGGAGADTLIGGAGNDRYFVDHVGDRIIEAGGQGLDVVIASVSYTLGSGQEIEYLGLASGDAPLDITGNAVSNRMVGNDGANRIDGGAGIDTMFGGKGDDTYFVDAFDDYVAEAAGEGCDTIYTTSDYCYFDGQEIEFLIGNAGATGLHLMGNELAQTIIGNSGDDFLHGDGGADTLIGGKGQDTFVFLELHDGAPGADRCVIADFEQGVDRILLTPIQAVTGSATNQPFDWIGSERFSGKAGELHQVTLGGTTLIEGDVNGDRIADIQIELKGLYQLTAGDFQL